MGLFDEKARGRKSRDTVPLMNKIAVAKIDTTVLLHLPTTLYDGAPNVPLGNTVNKVVNFPIIGLLYVMSMVQTHYTVCR
jgi:hypothetical protein